MTRIGLNPARNRVSDYRPARVTICMLVYMPHLTGYFEHRFDVVRLCLASLFRHTEPPFDLLVLDNGSCEEVKSFLRGLQQEGRLRFLLTAQQNLGKAGALRVMAGAAPGELIAYTDDDTFFFPGWLPAHLRVMDKFPRVGMVSGSPERTLFDHGIGSTLAWARAEPRASLRYGQRIPEDWELEWAESLGKDPAEFLDRVRQLQDITVEWDGELAYTTACHNQFLSPKSVLVELLRGEWTGRLMGGMNELDNAIDAAGYLRLTTLERTTRLIGNTVGEPMADQARRLGLSAVRSAGPHLQGGNRTWTARMTNWKPVRWLLQGLYNRLFWILTGQSGGWLPADPGRGNREP